jgi:hypothetical protein
MKGAIYTWFLCSMLFLVACTQSDELIQSLEGTYTLQRFTKDSRDSIFTYQGIPVPVLQSEIVFSPNGYKGLMSARLQAAPDSAALQAEGEYYVALRSFKREGIKNTVTPKSIIFGINRVIFLRKAFPLTDTINIDSLRNNKGVFKTSLVPNLFNGEWTIDNLAKASGEILELKRKGIGEDSVHIYRLELLRQ